MILIKLWIKIIKFKINSEVLIELVFDIYILKCLRNKFNFVFVREWGKIFFL